MFDTYESEEQDILFLLDTITQDIVNEFNIVLGNEQLLIVKHNTDNPEAFKAYSFGESYFEKGTHEGFRAAQENFKKATNLDKNYALAYIGLAKTFLARGAWFGDMVPKDAYREAETAIRDALKIDNNMGEAHTLLGWIEHTFNWNWAEAKNKFELGISYSPNSPITHFYYVNYLRCFGRLDEALAQCNIGLEKDHTSSNGLTELSFIYLQQGEIDQAFNTAMGVYGMYSDRPACIFTLGYMHYVKGETDEALELWRKFATEPKADSINLCFLGRLYALKGEKDNAEDILVRLENKEERGYFVIASLYDALGKKNDALKYLKKGLTERDPHMVWLSWLERIPESEVKPKICELEPFYNLSNDPNFIEIINQMNFPKEQLWHP
ncbi:tetratricopeptide repeat protein [Planctomycetota bacterium]